MKQLANKAVMGTPIKCLHCILTDPRICSGNQVIESIVSLDLECSLCFSLKSMSTLDVKNN